MVPVTSQQQLAARFVWEQAIDFQLREDRVPHARWVEEGADLERPVSVQDFRAADADARVRLNCVQQRFDRSRRHFRVEI